MSDIEVVGITHWRDRMAWWLANKALSIATPWYRDMIAGTIEYGMRAANRDAREGRGVPEDWRL